MKKSHFTFNALLFCLLILSTGCTTIGSNTATISVHSNSDYVKTFEDLDLGIVYDFDFRLPEADKRWVTIWVEGYKDGKKEPNPINQLSYGASPNSLTKGRLGFGIINPDLNEPLLFLYAPDISGSPHKIEKDDFKDGASTWEYAIGDEKVKLKLGETKLLGVYRQSADGSMRTYDLQKKDQVAISGSPHKIEKDDFKDGASTWEYAIGDEKVKLKLGETKLLGVYRQSADGSMRTYDLQKKDQVAQMIKKDSRVLLLKIKIEEINE